MYFFLQSNFVAIGSLSHSVLFFHSRHIISYQRHKYSKRCMFTVKHISGTVRVWLTGKSNYWLMYNTQDVDYPTSNDMKYYMHERHLYTIYIYYKIYRGGHMEFSP